jgi:transcriptional regulator with XRE-family HTH domain
MTGPSLRERLKDERVARGMTLADVAALAGVSRQAVWFWERGDRFPRLDRLTAWAAALDLRVEILLAPAAGKGAAWK